MKLRYYPKEKLKKEIIEILGRRLNLGSYRVFFFGSRVTGKAMEGSDIDVGIEGTAPVSDAAWAQIHEELDNLPTLYKIDMVDFKRVGPKFKEVALRHIEIICDPPAVNDVKI